MIYNTIEDLPTHIKQKLPIQAQETYLKAFNEAWEEYGEPRLAKSNEGREQAAHTVAWNAATKFPYDDITTEEDIED